jgi:hypothetical protein
MAEGGLHLIKVAAGCESLLALQTWQAERRARFGRVFHLTRMMPRRRAELLTGGSIYWVIRGFVQARQELLDIEATASDDGRRTIFVLDPRLIPTEALVWPVFQGWRYLPAGRAPADRGQGKGRPRGFEEMPEPMYLELRQLGLA